MSGASTFHDVTLTVAARYNTAVAGNDRIFKDWRVTEDSAITWSGLIPGNLYDIRIFSYSTQLTQSYDGMPKTTGPAGQAGTATWTGVQADENGEITGIWSETGSNDFWYGAQIQGDFVTVPEAAFHLVMNPNGDDFDFEWASQPGKVYDLLTSSDLASPDSEWPVYDPDGAGGNPPYGEFPAEADSATTSLTAVPGDGPRRFFAVAEKDAPPPIEE